MTCVDYNLVKEGSLKNSSTTASGITLLTDSQISALYDGDDSTPVVVISGSPGFISLRQEFGEVFDVCYLRYHTNAPTASGLSFKYTTNNGTVYTLSPFLESANVYRADINDEVRFIDIVHTVSGTGTNEVYEFEIIPVRNEKLGFGEASSPIDYFQAPHATTDVLSATANAIKIFNDSQYDDIAKIAVLPTLTEVDNYIYVGTSSSGIFYGINEYGFSHPGPNPIKLQDESFVSDTMSPQWKRRAPAAPHTITPTAEGLIFSMDYLAFGAGSQTRNTTGIYSSEMFTARSFTAEFQIRFLSLDLSPGLADAASRDFFFALTNSFPIPDVGYKNTWSTDRRRGGSIAGLAMKPDSISAAVDFTYEFRWVDGPGTSDPREGETEDRWTNGELSGQLGADQFGEVGTTFGPSLEEFEDIVNNGDPANDFTSTANWHTWRITYDHIKKEISGFVDGVLIGTRLMNIESFNEACWLFIGMHGNGGVSWAVKNFKIHKDVVYRQKNVASYFRGGTATATVSGSFASAVIDESTTSRYVAPEPNSNTIVRIDFDQPYDVCYYKIKQRDQDNSVSAYGHTYFPDIARQAIVNFGDDRLEVHLYPNDPEYVTRAPTHSGTGYTTASGISYMSFRFTDYDRTTDGDGALVIEEIEVYAEEYVAADPTPEPTALETPWVSGRWLNLKQYGNTNSLALRARDAIMPSYLPMPEYFLEGVDWGASSSLAGRQFADSANEYHFGGSIFSSRGTSDSGDYRQWHSDFQGDNHIFLWRYFNELSEVASVYWDSNAYHGGAPAIADKFKFQYLIENGNPNTEADWVNIPPIQKPHPYTGGSNNADTNYKNYRYYLMTHNDGEYYTDYFLVTSSGTGFAVGSNASLTGVPRGLAVPPGYVGSSIIVQLSTTAYPSNNGDQGYVEFDEPVTTRAIRMVVHTVRTGSTSVVVSPGEERFEFALDEFRVFRLNGAGSYTSPVFDTGTKQNTERLFSSVRNFDGTSHAVYVRSSEEPPEDAYNPIYEVWESVGRPGSVTISYNEQSVHHSDRVIKYGNLLYFIREGTPKIYDPALDLWSNAPDYPVAGGASDNTFGDAEDGNTNSSSGADTDTGILNHSALIGDTIYVACRTTGDNQRPRVMRLDLSVSDPQWVLFGENRPTFAENAVMAADVERERLYFFHRDGTVSYYDIPGDNWFVVDAVMPTYGGTRTGIASTVVGRNIYLFGGSVGGNGIFNCDVFNLDTETFSVIQPSLFRIVFSQAIYVPEEAVIYLFPVNGGSGSAFNATMKYHIEGNYWEVCESLMWFDDAGQLQEHLADFYFYNSGYIQRMAFLFGMSRAYVLTTPWTAGTVPDFRDPKWGGPVGQVIPWVEVDELGELMPQERYIQFKVELYSHDLTNTPVLEDITIVMPQDVHVPASGTANAYFKVGAIPSLNYQAWYSAAAISPTANLSNAFNTLYTESEDGVSWDMATIASGIWQGSGDSANERNTTYGPWVLKESGVYQVWFVKDHTSPSSHDPEIYYATHTSPDDFSLEIKVVAKAAISQSTKGAKYPCVIKLSPSSYKMWYTGLDSSDVQRIIMASSTNGTTWTSHTLSLGIGNIPQDANGSSRPCVLLEGSTYRMWYTGAGSDGYDRVLYTESSDGLSWSLPIIALDILSEGDVDSRGCSNAIVLKDGPEYLMYYVGFNGTENYIVKATSPDSAEWFNFEIVIPPGGIIEYEDSDGLKDIYVISNREGVIPGTVFTTAQLKIYNAGAAV